MNFLSLLVLTASLELGMTQGAVMQYQPIFSYKVDIPPCYATFEGSLSYKGLFLNGSVRTDMKMIEPTNWLPMQNTYTIGGGMKAGPLTVGFEHSCFHPMTPYATMMPREKQAVPKWEGSYDRVYLRFEISSRDR